MTPSTLDSTVDLCLALMVMTTMKTITKYDYELAFSLDSADENDSSQSPSNQRGDSPRVHFHFCLESASKIGSSSLSSWSPPTLTGNFATLAGGSGTYEEAPGGSP